MNKYWYLFFAILPFYIQANDEVLLDALKAYLKTDLPQFKTAYYDLNQDGYQDAFVYLNDRDWCGTGGCTALIFKGCEQGYQFKSKSMVTQLPILVTNHSSRGWFDIIVSTRGKEHVILAFDGQRYPINPSMQPSAPSELVNQAKLILDNSEMFN